MRTYCLSQVQHASAKVTGQTTLKLATNEALVQFPIFYFRHPLMQFAYSLPTSVPDHITHYFGLSATMAMKLRSKVGLIFCFTTTVLMICSVEGVHVSIGSMMTPIMTVHCTKENLDEGVREVRPMHEYSFDVPGDFRGPYVCNFAAAGKRTTTLDVCNSRCNCDTYSGCAWVVRNDGFYCNHDLIRIWA